MERKPNNVNKFWLSYRDAVMASGIAEKTAKWYVRWAQEFAVSIKGKPLRSRSGETLAMFVQGVHKPSCKSGLCLERTLTFVQRVHNSSVSKTS
jgi:hypothetical protein